MEVTERTVQSMAENGDKELVERTRSGDRDAYRQLVEKYQQRAFAIAFEMLRNREDAEDVVQESFVKAYLSLADYRGDASFYTWLYRIVYNMTIDFKRKIARRGGPALEFDEVKSVEQGEGLLQELHRRDGPEEMAVRKEQAQHIQKVLSEISDEHRTVVVLREIDGMNYDQIAKVLGISKGTVMSRLHYARKRLQQGLKNLLPGGGEERARGNEGNSNEHAAERTPQLNHYAK